MNHELDFPDRRNEVVYHYNEVSHASLNALALALVEGQTFDHALAESARRKAEAAAKKAGITPRQISKAKSEGQLVARLRYDPDFKETYTAEQLEDMSETFLSPAACESRRLKLIEMVKDEQINGWIDKNTGKDILPELRAELTHQETPQIPITQGNL